MSGLCGRTMCTLSFSQRGRQPEEVTGSPSGTQKIPGSNIRGFLIICARYWVRTSEGKNFPSARGTNKSFPRRGRQPEEVTGSPPGTQKIPGSNIRGFLIICARYWVRTSEGKNFPSARGTNKSFPRRGRQPEEVTGSPLGIQKIPGSNIRGFHTCARYWDRTSDLFRVREARYRCANRAYNINVLCEVRTGFEPAYTALQAAA